MVQTTTLAEQLLEVIAQHPGSGLDELVMLCPDYTWNQIFLEVDHLSRCGHLQLVQISPGRYAVSVLTHWRFYAPQSREARLSLRNLTQSQQDGHAIAVVALWSGRAMTSIRDGVAFSVERSLTR
jgi:hypothetical protein